MNAAKYNKDYGEGGLMRTLNDLFIDSCVFGENEFVINELNKITASLGAFKGGYRVSREIITNEAATDYLETYWLLMETALIKIAYNTTAINYEVFKRDMIVSVRKNFKIRITGKIVSELNEIILELINGKLIKLVIPSEINIFKKDFNELVDQLVS